METFGLLRIRYPSFDDVAFDKTVAELIEKTQYSLRARDEDAPGVTHCVSAVRYILARTTGWVPPHFYIGDLCRKILDLRELESRIVPIKDGERGDLIFFHRRSVVHRAYMITHVGILVDEDSFFHSAWRENGGIDAIQSNIHKGNIATCKMLVRLTDPRGKDEILAKI